MNIKSEKGITGMDIAISVILIAVFVSLISVLSFNIQKTQEDINRKSEATSYAIKIIEQIKLNGFSKLPEKGTNKIDGFEDGYIIDDKGKTTPYYQEITVKDYSELEGNEEKEPEIIKIITVKISYKSGNKTENVEITTDITKEE